jgi:WD40 repeat protein
VTREALIDEAWASGDPKVVAALYAKHAKKDDVVALAMARLGNRDNECTRAMFEENAALVAPVIASWLAIPERLANAAGTLGHLGDKRAIPVLLRKLESSKDDAADRCLHALAMLGDDAVLAMVASRVTDDTPFAIAGELVRRGVESMRGRGIDAIERWLGKRAKNPLERHDRDDAQTAIFAMDVLAEGGAHEAIDVLHRALVQTPYVEPVMRALAKLADERSREPARRMLSMLGGDDERNWPYRLGLHAILRALGETPPLDAARDVVRWSHPQRYGWPKVEDHAALLALAAHELLSGTPHELEWVATLATAPLRAVRIVGIEAWRRLHGSSPLLRWFDPEHVKVFLKEEKPARVLEVIEEKTTVYRHNLVRGLASTKDAKTRKALVEICVHAIESRSNHRVSYYEQSDMGHDAHGFFAALQTLAKDKATKKRLESSTAPWIQHHFFDKDPAWPERPEPASPLSADVAKLGVRADGAFAVGRQVNALALSNDGARLFVAGDSLGVVLDAKTGATLVEIELKWNWAYDAVFSLDDSRLVVGYHGGHLEVFDAKTGKREGSFAGHGGVPNGIKRVTLSPDGKTLLSCGSDGRAFLWSFPSGKKLRSIGDGDGSFEGAAFSRDGKRFALAHWKKGVDSLFVGDVKTGKTKRWKTKNSMWAVLFLEDGTLVSAGDGKHIHFWDSKGKEKKKIAQAKVVRLRDDGQGGIFALSQTGELQHWKLENNLRTKMDVGEGNLWAMVLGSDGMVYVAGTAGVLHRFDADRKKLQSTPLLAHTGQVRGFAILEDGRFFTAGWDGKLILWSKAGVAENIVHAVEERMTEIVLTPDRKHLLVLHGSGLLCIDAGTHALVGEYKAKKLQSSINNVECVGVSNDGAVAAIGEWGGGVRTFRVPTLGPLLEKSTGMKKEVSSIAPYGDGWVAGNDAGLLFGLSPSLEVLWTIAEHGRDLVEGEPMGNPHKTVMSIAVQGGFFVSAATDHTARLWDSSRTQMKRWLVGSGLFNNAAFSPSGTRVALTSSWHLVVFDARSGDTLAHVGRKSFQGVDELTRSTFVSEDELLVGAENGNLYRVGLTPTTHP